LGARARREKVEGKNKFFLFSKSDIIGMPKKNRNLGKSAKIGKFNGGKGGGKGAKDGRKAGGRRRRSR